MKKYGPFCVVDNGLFCELSRTVSPHVEESSYYARWENAFPSLFQMKIGDFPGVNRILDYHDIIDEMKENDGTWIFPDILFAGLQVHLESLGHAVWGARHGEDLENYRVEFRELCKELGIGAPEYETCTGVTALRKLLAKYPDRWVKVSLIRGNMETWYSENVKLAEPWLASLRRSLGPWAELQEFIVEKPIPKSVEIAYDSPLIDGEHADKFFLGLEIKSEALFGMLLPYTQCPKPLADINGRIGPALGDYHFRCNAPIELRVKEDGSYVALDPCMREGSPSFAAKHKLITNLPKIYHGGARGEVVNPETKDGECCSMELLLYSDYAREDAMPVYFPPEIRDNVFLRYAAEVDGVCWVLPQLIPNTTLGSIVTTGKSWQDCRKKMDDIKDLVKGRGLNYYGDALDKTKTEWEKLQDFGIDLPKL
jgi:hypothetical protein